MPWRRQRRRLQPLYGLTEGPRVCSRRWKGLGCHDLPDTLLLAVTCWATAPLHKVCALTVEACSPRLRHRTLRQHVSCVAAPHAPSLRLARTLAMPPSEAPGTLGGPLPLLTWAGRNLQVDASEKSPPLEGRKGVRQDLDEDHWQWPASVQRFFRAGMKASEGRLWVVKMQHEVLAQLLVGHINGDTSHCHLHAIDLLGREVDSPA